MLIQKGAQTTRQYLDYSYTPIVNDYKRTIAILVLANDSEERKLIQIAKEESDRNLFAIVGSSIVPMCVFKGPEFKIVAVNDLMTEIWHQQHETNHCSERTCPHCQDSGKMPMENVRRKRG